MAYKDKLKEIAAVLYDEAGNPILSVPFQMDDTDKVAVSVYGKGTAAGDTALDVDSDGHVQADVLSIAAGANIIGKVGIDQTTPGTTNGVAIKGKNAAVGDTDIKASPAGGLWIAAGGSGTGGDGNANTIFRFKDKDDDSNQAAGVYPMLLNPSTTWDRVRSIAASGAGLGVQQVGTLGELITLAASAARTTGANGTAVTGLGWRNRYIVLFDVTALATDADDTLNLYVDISLDGTTWMNAIHATQRLGNGAAAKEFAVLDPSAPGTAMIAVTSDAAAATVRPSMFGPQMRARWAIVDPTGANVSFTFSIVAYAI